MFTSLPGRINDNGFIPSNLVIPDGPSAELKPQHHGFLSPDDDTVPVSFDPLAPDDVLFKTKNAPLRYEEDDVYFAQRYLASHQRLPDSDLLKAVHAYASDFYSGSLGDQAKMDWRSMDETALLALGILMEEAAADVLGETGDLTFVEGEDDDPLSMPQAWTGSGWARSVIRRGHLRPRHKAREEPGNESRDFQPMVADASSGLPPDHYTLQQKEEPTSEDNGKQGGRDPE